MMTSAKRSPPDGANIRTGGNGGGIGDNPYSTTNYTAGRATGQDDFPEIRFAPFRPFGKPVLETLPPFPVDALPLAPYIKSASANIQVDPAMVCGSVLAALATCVQRVFYVPVRDGWTEPLSFFHITIADASQLKSPVFKRTVFPIEEHEEQENRINAENILAWQSNKRICEARIAKLEKKAANSKDAESVRDEIEEARRELFQLMENEVRPLQLTIDDATVESVKKMMSEQNGRIAVFSEEASTVFGIAAGRYSEGRSDLSAYLHGYSGGTIKVNRVGRPGFVVRNAALTMNLFIQTKLMDKVMQTGDFSDSGLLARFCYCFPRSYDGNRTFQTPRLDEQSEDAYRNCITFLLGFQHEPPSALRFSADALSEFGRFYHEIESRLNEDLYPIKAWAGKYRGLVARIAGLLHCAKCGTVYPWTYPNQCQIDRETLLQAERIGAYYLETAKVIFSGLADNETEKDALYLMEKFKGERRISLHDLKRRCRRFDKNPSAMKTALTALKGRGYVAMKESNGAHRHSVTVYANPDCGL